MPKSYTCSSKCQVNLRQNDPEKQSSSQPRRHPAALFPTPIPAQFQATQTNPRHPLPSPFPSQPQGRQTNPPPPLPSTSPTNYLIGCASLTSTIPPRSRTPSKAWPKVAGPPTTRPSPNLNRDSRPGQAT